MRRRGVTRASTLGPIADVVTTQGGSIERVFRRAELPLRLIESPDTLVPLREHFRLLSVAARELHDDAFGGRLGSQTSLAGLGVYGKWVVQAPTLLEAMHRAGSSLTHMLQSSTRLGMRRQGDEIHWSYELADPATEGRPQNEMLALWYKIVMIRQFAGPDWLPRRVVVGGLSAAARRAIEEATGVETANGDGPGRLVFDHRLLLAVNPNLRENRGLDAGELARIFDIPAPDDLPGNVGALIDLELLGGRPELARVARRTGLSTRTFQRRLAALGLSFSDILTHTRQRQAIRLLCQTDESITGIALRLGYRDPAHFSRAFETWSGVAPSRWRELAKSCG